MSILMFSMCQGIIVICYLWNDYDIYEMNYFLFFEVIDFEVFLCYVVGVNFIFFFSRFFYD